MKSIIEIQKNMAHATGSMSYTKHWLGLILTDGIIQLREDADCFWLVDAIASYKRKEEFQLWELETNLKEKSAVLTMKTDTNNPELVRQEIEYTDFPLKKIQFYVQLGSIDGINPCYVMMLPSEY